MIIGIAGKKQAGKDSFCRFITENVSGITPTIFPHKFSYADPLKVFLIKGGVISHEQAYGTEEQKNSPTKVEWRNMPLEIREEFNHIDQDRYPFLTARQVMQVFGTNVMRKMFCDSIWLNYLQNECTSRSKEQEKKNGIFLAIVPDVRFINEISMIKDFGGTVVYIDRKDHPGESDGHSSETGVRPEDCDLYYSAGHISELEEHAKEFVNVLFDQETLNPV